MAPSRKISMSSEVSGKVIYGIDVKLPGMKWAAVKSCRSMAAGEELRF